MKDKQKKNSLNSIRKEIQRTQLTLIVSITVLLAIGGSLINIHANEKALDQNLQNTAELVSRLYEAERFRNQFSLSAYFDSVLDGLSDIDVISIIDTDNTRLYHSNHSLIGTVYDGTHPDFAGYNRSFYTENDIGPSGPQRRAYCAVYDDNGNYLGFTMTIMLRTSIHQAMLRTIALFLLVTVVAVLVELAISKTVSHKIKKRFMGYEPDTFSSMFKIRDNILESINDGIVAVNSDGSLAFMNSNAKKLLCGEDGNPEMSAELQSGFIKKFTADSVDGGEPILNLHEKTKSGAELLIDCIPIKEDGAVTGAVAILHDRTEYTKLMEDLSGTKYLVDSMRANNHDFTNKLHVILGLIQIGRYEQAVDYIQNISLIQRETISSVMKCIDNPSFAALLVGKIARASECNVKFVLREGSSYKSAHINFPSEALITICGNLIENALDSMNLMTADETDSAKELVFGVFTKPGSLLITVDDTGCGIPDEIKERIFENGFSTKRKGRGIGLHHIKELVESLGGTISFESQVGQGTSFMVHF